MCALMIEDAHLHFFSKGVLAFYARQVESLKEELDPATAAAAYLGIEPPPAEPEALAARWVAEMDEHGVGRAALFGSAPGEHSTVGRAARAFPDRFVPFQMVNPRTADPAGAVRTLAENGIRGVLLFPAMHGYYPDDEAVAPVYKAALEHGLVLFVHLGRLKIAIRDKLGITAGAVDERYGDPDRLVRPLREHPQLPFLVPHFGCGTLPGLLVAARGVRNLYVDTSSANGWMADDAQHPTLEAAFRAVLDSPDLGPERVLFGSDSTVFPRGFRADILRRQTEALEALGVSAADRAAIFGGNFRRLLP
jgi:predicted TIM-barrel fold metal-dependent hydrolase